MKPSDTVTQLTIRGLKPVTRRALQDRADQDNTSLNEAALGALDRGLNIDRRLQSVEERRAALNAILDEIPPDAEDSANQAQSEAYWRDRKQASLAKKEREYREGLR